MTDLKLGDRLYPMHNRRIEEVVVAIDGDDIVTLHRYTWQGRPCRKAQVHSRDEVERYYEIERWNGVK